MIASALAAMLVYFVTLEILRNQLHSEFPSAIAALLFASAGHS